MSEDNNQVRITQKRWAFVREDTHSVIRELTLPSDMDPDPLLEEGQYMVEVSDDVDLVHKRINPSTMEIEEDLSASAQAARAAALSRRNSLLLASDWTQVADSPLSPAKRAAWGVYRQALRDLPAKKGFPEVDWPALPA